MTIQRNKSDLIHRARKVATTMDDFSINDLARAADIGHDTAKRFTNFWLEDGLVELARSEGRKRFYRPTAKMTARGALSNQEQPTKQDNMWRAMRGLMSFTPTDIAAHANTSEVPVTPQDASDYCQLLVRAAYLRVLVKALPGRREARYRLVRNTGPRPPRERRIRGVFDDNTGEFVKTAGGRK